MNLYDFLEVGTRGKGPGWVAKRQTGGPPRLHSRRVETAYFVLISFVTTFCTKVKLPDSDSAEPNLSGATALEGVPMLDSWAAV